MTKVRSKNVKAKIQPTADFKRSGKKHTKVGRKVKRANVTKITVKSKSIIIPNQSITDDNRVDTKLIKSSTIQLSNENEKEILDQLIKQLRHYSESNRVKALEEMKEYFSNSANAQSWIALVIPEVIELIFDIEQKVRDIVIDIVSTVLIRFPSDSLKPIISIIVTYICSGLTNIHRGVKKDSLVILYLFCTKCLFLLMPNMIKLVNHVVLLMNEYSKTSAVNMVNSGTSNNSNNNNQASQENKKRNDKVKSSFQDIKSKKVFPLILNILEVIFSGSISSNMNNNNKKITIKNIDYVSGSNHNSILVLNRVSFQSNFSQNSDSTRENSDNNNNSIPESIIIDLYDKLSIIWEGMVLDSSLLSNEKISLLTDATKIIIGIIKLNQENTRNNKFFDLLEAIFQSFPYICLEASLASPGSDIELSGRKNVSVLNVSICEIVFTFCSFSLNDSNNNNNNNNNIERLLDITCLYLFESLQDQVDFAKSIPDDSTYSNNNDELNIIIISRMFSCFEIIMKVGTETFMIITKIFQLLKIFKDFVEYANNKKHRKSLKNINYLLMPIINCVCDTITNSMEESNYFYMSNSEANQLINMIISLTPSLIIRQKTANQNTIVLKIVNCMLQLQQKSNDSSNYNLSKPYLTFFQKNKESNCYFYSLREDIRIGILEIYYYLKLDGDELIELSQIIFDCLSDSNSSKKEQTYYLRLFYERKLEFPLDAFFELIFEFLQKYNQRNSNNNADLNIFEVVSNNNVLEYISQIIIWSSSSDFPIRVIAYLIPKLEYYYNNLEMNESNWIYVYKMSISLIIIINRLLSPWMTMSNTYLISENKDKQTIDNIVNLISKIIIFIISKLENIVVTTTTNREDLKFKMLLPVSELLKSKLYIIENENEIDNDNNNNNNNNNKGTYLLFIQLLIKVSEMRENVSNNNYNNIIAELGFLLLRDESCQKVFNLIEFENHNNNNMISKDLMDELLGAFNKF